MRGVQGAVEPIPAAQPASGARTVPGGPAAVPTPGPVGPARTAPARPCRAPAAPGPARTAAAAEPSCPQLRRSEEHTSELQSRGHLVCRLLLEKKKSALLAHAGRRDVEMKTHASPMR